MVHQPRRRLAVHRRQLGYSQESLAHKLGVVVRTVAAWEQGTSNPRPRLRRVLAEALELTPFELELLFEGADDGSAGVSTHGILPTWLGVWASMERGAAELRTFEPLVVPALLQTDAYARAMEASHYLPVTPQEVAARVEARLQRQAVLTRTPLPLSLMAVIDESVMHRVVGSADIMAAQLDHLVDMAKRPNIDLRVAPMRDGLCGHVVGAFHLLTAPGSSLPYVASSEDLVDMRYHEARDAVTAHLDLFNVLVERSLDGEASLDLVRETKKEFDDKR